jgi:hypothetical protein
MKMEKLNREIILDKIEEMHFLTIYIQIKHSYLKNIGGSIIHNTLNIFIRTIYPLAYLK